MKEQIVNEEGYDDLGDFSEDQMNNADIPYVPDPIRNPTELDAEIIKSHYKEQNIIIRVPIFKQVEIAEVFKNKEGKPRLVKGVPVIKEMKTINVFNGYEEKEVVFPIKNLYTDSLTSSILDKDEASVVRDHHDLIWRIGMLMLTDRDFDSIRFIHRLNGATATLLESAKSIGGGGLEWSKSSISKQESKSYDFRQQQGFDEYQSRLSKRKGLFGLGFGPDILNK